MTDRFTVECQHPFRHWVVDGLLPRGFSSNLTVPERNWSGWVRYDNDVERRKRTSNDLEALGPEWVRLFNFLNGSDTVDWLAKLTGVDGLRPDPTLHGAGCHVLDPGGSLGCHLDYARHPLLPEMERRVNLILFLQEDHPRDVVEDFRGLKRGGGFDLYEDDGATLAARVPPRPNRAVIWCPGDVEYHGSQEVAADAPPRVTAACYYLAPRRPTAVRKRALFVPRRERSKP